MCGAFYLLLLWTSAQKVTVRKPGSVGERWGGIGVLPSIVVHLNAEGDCEETRLCRRNVVVGAVLPSTVADLNTEGDCEETWQCRSLVLLSDGLCRWMFLSVVGFHNAAFQQMCTAQGRLTYKWQLRILLRQKRRSTCPSALFELG